MCAFGSEQGKVYLFLNVVLFWRIRWMLVDFIWLNKRVQNRRCLYFSGEVCHYPSSGTDIPVCVAYLNPALILIDYSQTRVSVPLLKKKFCSVLLQVQRVKIILTTEL